NASRATHSPVPPASSGARLGQPSPKREECRRETYRRSYQRPVQESERGAHEAETSADAIQSGRSEPEQVSGLEYPGAEGSNEPGPSAQDPRGHRRGRFFLRQRASERDPGDNRDEGAEPSEHRNLLEVADQN